MAKSSIIQTSFEWGELSERLISRIDLPAYKKGVKTLLNGYPWLHGGVTKRHGTVMCEELRNSSRPAEFIPYDYDDSVNKFVCVFNDGKIRFIRDGVYVRNAGVPVEIDHPYSDAELPFIKYAQPDRTVFLVHPNHPPKELVRYSDTNWGAGNITFTYRAVSDITFSNASISFRIINGSNKFAAGQSFTVTTTSTGAIASYTVNPSAGAGNGILSAVVAMPTAVQVAETFTITCVFATSDRQEWTVTGSSSGNLISYWRPGSYPQAVGVANQRLWFGGSPNWHQHIWSSQAGDLYNLTVGNRESDAIIAQMVGGKRGRIVHIEATKYVSPLTTKAEWSYSAANGTLSGTSSNEARPHTKHGVSHVKPAAVGQEVLIVDRARKLRAISYTYTEDSNIAPDLMMMAEHLTRNGSITSMGFAASPDYLLWAVRSDGTLLTMTRNRDVDNTTAAWARHTTDGVYEKVCVIETNTASDDVYVLVKRTINGVTKRFIERFDYDEEDVVFTDCSSFFDGAPTTVFPVPHLIGKEVAIFADGAVHRSQVVPPDGNVTLQRPASTVAIGLPYTMTVELLNPEFGDASSSSQGKRVKISEIIARFQDTITASINGRSIPFRNSTDGFEPIEPFTGDKSIAEYGWSSEQHITIECSTPSNMSILCLIIEANVSV